MGRIITTSITDFSGGMTDNKRNVWSRSGDFFTTSYSSLIKHFDMFRDSSRLIPNYKTETDETKTDAPAWAMGIKNFLYAPYDSGYRLWGLGVRSAGSTQANLFVHDNDLTATGWTNPLDSASDTTADRVTNVFFYYKSYIYWWSASKLCRCDATSSAAAADYKSIVATKVAQPVKHPEDDIAYFFADNDIYDLNNTTWCSGGAGPSLTLPDDLYIASACPYGHYLAIGCTETKTYNKRSYVYLWDRDSSLTTVTAKIDFGEGEIRHLVNLDNKLFAIMSYYLNSTLSLSRGKILIKQASGNFANIVNEINCDAVLGEDDALPKSSFVSDNKIYFPAQATYRGSKRIGIWVMDSFGRIAIPIVEEDANSVNSYQAIIKIAEQWWISHSDDGSITRTDDAAGYGATSIWETPTFTAGDSSLKKQLKRATVTMEKQPSAGQVVLKYRVDGATDWTTIFTEATDDAIEHTAINIESSGSEFPHYNEIEFRVESTGGTVITGLRFESEIIDSRI